MATCKSPSFTPLKTRSPMGVLTVLGGRASMETHLGKVGSLKMFDEKHVLGTSHKVTLNSLQIKCSANSHRVNHYQNNEASLVRGDENTTVISLKQDSSSGSLREISTNSLSSGNQNQAKLKVIGVGGAGSNAVNRMIDSELQGVEFWIANTDVQALNMSPVPQEKRLQIGFERTKGLGAGGKPDVGMDAANESKDSLKDAISDADMLFVTAGMGGGTGTGAAPVVAEIAKSLDILTVGIVSTPFYFEGEKRALKAQEGIAALREKVDTLIIIPNDKLLTAAAGSAFTDAFKKADEVLHQGVRGISDIIMIPGQVNVDFADVRSIMQNAGSSLMGIGTATGNDRAKQAALCAIQSPLLDIGIERATGVVWNITAGSDLTLTEISDAAEVIKAIVHPSANIIFGSVLDPSMSGQVSITIIATGFKRDEDSNGSQGGPREPENITSEGSQSNIPRFLQRKVDPRYR